MDLLDRDQDLDPDRERGQDPDLWVGGEVDQDLRVGVDRYHRRLLHLHRPHRHHVRDLVRELRLGDPDHQLDIGGEKDR